MGYEINEVLQRLEKNLEAVDSARNQVTSVVNSNVELQDVFRNLTNSLVIMQEHLKGVVAEITTFQNAKIADVENIVSRMDKTSQELLKLFEKQSGDAISEFKEGIMGSLAKLDSEVNNLEDCVKAFKEQREAMDEATKAIRDVETKLDKISSDLINSQTEQDTTLSEISDSVNSVASSISSMENGLSESIKRISKQIADASEFNDAAFKKNRKGMLINWIFLCVILGIAVGCLVVDMIHLI